MPRLQASRAARAPRRAHAARAATVLVVLAVLGEACASTPAPRPAPEPARERAFVPYAPGPGEAHTPATSMALTTGGGEDQARRVVLALVEAVLEGDAHAMGSLFAPRVAIVREGRQVGRDEAVRRCLRAGGRASWQTESRAEDAVDLEALEVGRADAAHAPSPLPSGIRGSDLITAATLLPAFRGPNERSAHTCLEGIYVRPGQQPLIVGLQR